MNVKRPCVIEYVEPLHHGVHHGGAKVLRLLALGYVGHDHADSNALLLDPNRVVAREPVPRTRAHRSSDARPRVHRWLAGLQHADGTRAPSGAHTSGTISATVRPICSCSGDPLTSASVSFIRTMRQSRSTNAKPTGAADWSVSMSVNDSAVCRCGLGQLRHILDGTDETPRTTLALVRHGRKGAQDVDACRRARSSDRQVRAGSRRVWPDSISRSTRSRSSGCTRPITYSGVGVTEPGSTPRRRNMLSDHSRTSVSRSHSQVPVCASCSARSSAARSGRSREASSSLRRRVPASAPASEALGSLLGCWASAACDLLQSEAESATSLDTR